MHVKKIFQLYNDLQKMYEKEFQDSHSLKTTKYHGRKSNKHIFESRAAKIIVSMRLFTRSSQLIAKKTVKRETLKLQNVSLLLRNRYTSSDNKTQRHRIGATLPFTSATHHRDESSTDIEEALLRRLLLVLGHPLPKPEMISLTEHVVRSLRA